MSKLSRSVSTCSKDSKSMSSEASIISDSNFSYSKEESRSFEKQLDNMEGPEINEVKVVFVKYPDECCPKCCVRRCKCCDIVDKTRLGQKWWAFRCYMYKLVEHKYFETFIIVMILASSLALVSCLLGPWPWVQTPLGYWSVWSTKIFHPERNPRSFLVQSMAKLLVHICIIILLLQSCLLKFKATGYKLPPPPT